MDNTRIIALSSQFTKICEKAIMAKAEKLKLFDTGSYQRGFKKGKSTLEMIAKIGNELLATVKGKRTDRRIFIMLDLVKAFDTVNREKVFEAMMAKAEKTEDPETAKHLVELVKRLYIDHELKIGTPEEYETIKTNVGVP